MKISKIIKTISISLILTIVFSLAAFASTYGNLGSITVTSENKWQRAVNIKDTKAYSNEYEALILVTVKEMWSDPSAKIVSSDGTTYSSTTTINKVSDNPYAVSLYSNVKVGDTYYLSVKPAWNQVDSDLLTAKINVG